MFINVINRLLKINDKVLHFMLCLVITMAMNEACASVAAVTKEGADWLYKRNCNVGAGWDWKDILADVVGIALGSILRRLVFNY